MLGNFHSLKRAFISCSFLFLFGQALKLIFCPINICFFFIQRGSVSYYNYCSIQKVIYIYIVDYKLKEAFVWLSKFIYLFIIWNMSLPFIFGTKVDRFLFEELLKRQEILNSRIIKEQGTVPTIWFQNLNINVRIWVYLRPLIFFDFNNDHHWISICRSDWKIFFPLNLLT